MSEKIPLNAHVLRWARETAGWSLDEVAIKMKKDLDTVSAWETGRASPTYIQLEKLAYQLFKRPIALFFFQRRPKKKPRNNPFEHCPGRRYTDWRPKMIKRLKNAKTYHMDTILGQRDGH